MHQAMNRIVGAGTILMLAVHPGGGMAQYSRPNPSFAAPPPVPAERSDARGPLPAPVGHRQPKPSDLPPDAIKNENRADQGLRDLDAKLRICKGC